MLNIALGRRKQQNQSHSNLSLSRVKIKRSIAASLCYAVNYLEGIHQACTCIHTFWICFVIVIDCSQVWISCTQSKFIVGSQGFFRMVRDALFERSAPIREKKIDFVLVVRFGRKIKLEMCQGRWMSKLWPCNVTNTSMAALWNSSNTRDDTHITDNEQTHRTCQLSTNWTIF